MPVQQLVLQKAATALSIGGSLLFTAPAKAAKWTDVMTECEFISLGAEQYNALLAASRLVLIEESTFTIERYIEDGNYLTALGTIKLKDKDGKLVNYSVCDVWTFHDGKLAELKAFVIPD